MRLAPPMFLEELAAELSVGSLDQKYVVVVQHPLSSEWQDAGNEMRETMEALRELDLQTFVSYPNSDPGADQIIDVIESYRGDPRVSIFKNIPDGAF